MRRLKNIVFALLALLLLAHYGVATAYVVSPYPTHKTLLVWGDSLSAAYGIPVEKGWVNLLREKLGADYQVINGSISGETTIGGLTRLPEALRLHQPDYLLLELGANDGLRGLPTINMQENLEKMIQLAQKAQAKPVLIGIRLPPNYGMTYTEKFEQVYRDLAEQYQLPFIPFLLEGVAQDFKLMQADGLHPVAEAQPIVLEHVWATLEDVLKPAVPLAPVNAAEASAGAQE
ncbi:MAG: arylesterase [Thiolinea sp.]